MPYTSLDRPSLTLRRTNPFVEQRVDDFYTQQQVELVVSQELCVKDADMAIRAHLFEEATAHLVCMHVLSSFYFFMTPYWVAGLGVLPDAVSVVLYYRQMRIRPNMFITWYTVQSIVIFSYCGISTLSQTGSVPVPLMALLWSVYVNIALSVSWYRIHSTMDPHMSSSS
jgi:hypothetical protein